MLVSYHNHTRWSDGSPTIAEMVEGALAQGLDELGISDHFVLFPDRREVDWSMPLDLLGEYVAELQDTASRLDGIQLRLGVEADYLPGTAEQLRSELEKHPFDFIICSVHYVDEFPVDADRKYWDPLLEERINEIWREYWLRVRDMALERIGDIVAHLDLPKKYGFRPTQDLSAEEDQALDAIRAADLAIEINTAGWSLSAEEAYPSLRLLRKARERDIPLVISADAHSPAHLTRHFGRARELAREAGYDRQLRFHQRERFEIPL